MLTAPIAKQSQHFSSITQSTVNLPSASFQPFFTVNKLQRVGKTQVSSGSIGIASILSNFRNQTESDVEMLCLSTLKRRKSKMSKHKYRKRRKAQRSRVR